MLLLSLLLLAARIQSLGYGLTGPNGSTKRISRFVRLLGTKNEPLGNSMIGLGKTYHIYRDSESGHESSMNADVLSDEYFD
jgi:hypothetical protein